MGTHDAEEQNQLQILPSHILRRLVDANQLACRLVCKEWRGAVDLAVDYARPKCNNIHSLAVRFPNLTELDLSQACAGEVGQEPRFAQSHFWGGAASSSRSGRSHDVADATAEREEVATAGAAAAEGYGGLGEDGHTVTPGHQRSGSGQHQARTQPCTLLAASLASLKRLTRLKVPVRESTLFLGRGGPGECLLGVRQLLALSEASRLETLGLAGQERLGDLSAAQVHATLSPLTRLVMLDIGGVALRLQVLAELPAACSLLTSLVLRASTCADEHGGGSWPQPDSDGAEDVTAQQGTGGTCGGRTGEVGRGDERCSISGSSGLLAVLSQLQHLTHLDLSFSEWQLACPASVVLSRLRSLDLAGWSPHGRPSVRAPTFRALPMLAPHLTHLRLAHATPGLTPREVAALAAALPRLTALASLDLAHVRVGGASHGIISYNDGVVQGQVQQDVRGPEPQLNSALLALPQLTHCDLSGCEWLGVPTARALITAIPPLTYLTLKSAYVWHERQGQYRISSSSTGASRSERSLTLLRPQPYLSPAIPQLRHLDLGRVRVRTQGGGQGPDASPLCLLGTPTSSSSSSGAAESPAAAPGAGEEGGMNGAIRGSAAAQGVSLHPLPCMHVLDISAAWSGLMDVGEALGLGTALCAPLSLGSGHTGDTRHVPAVFSPATCIHLSSSTQSAGAGAGDLVAARPVALALQAWTVSGPDALEHMLHPFLHPQEGEGGEGACGSSERVIGGLRPHGSYAPLVQITELNMSGVRTGPELQGQETALLRVLSRLHGLRHLTLTGWHMPCDAYQGLQALSHAASSLVSLDLTAVNPTPNAMALQWLGQLTGLTSLSLDVHVVSRSYGVRAPQPTQAASVPSAPAACLINENTIGAGGQVGPQGGAGGSGAPLTRSALLTSALARLTGLVRLSVRNHELVDDACLAAVGRACVELATLNVDGCEALGPRGLQALLAEGRAPLRVLCCSWPAHIDKQVLTALGRYPTLRVLGLAHSGTGRKHGASRGVGGPECDVGAQGHARAVASGVCYEEGGHAQLGWGARLMARVKQAMKRVQLLSTRRSALPVVVREGGCVGGRAEAGEEEGEQLDDSMLYSMLPAWLQVDLHLCPG